MWNVGVGPAACFTRAISSIIREVKIQRSGSFDHVIEVDMKQAAVQAAGTSLSINDKLHLHVAEQLGLLDQEYHRLKEEHDELRYYTYGLDTSLSPSLHDLSRTSVVPQIIQKLLMKKYLLVVENLDEPIKPISTSALTEGLCFPAPRWKDSFWCISTTSQDVYGRSKQMTGYAPFIVESYSEDDIVILTLYSLHQAANYILGVTGHEDEQYWHNVAVRCFHYATMLLVPHCSSSHGDAGQQSSPVVLPSITSDELIRQWSAQGILVIDTERMGETTGTSSSGEKYSDIYQVGNVILEAFREYSLLELPFSPVTTEADQNAPKSAAHFLACHKLLTKHHTTDELLCEGEHPWLECAQLILHVGHQGWHLSREWLSNGASGTTTLILRHCSQESRLLAMLDHLLVKLPCLRVLDLSYSSVELLPPTFCLQKIQFLSLRGCYNITSPLSFSDSDIITLPENNSNTEIGLLHLDLSYSNVKTLHCDFFCRMPNLKELFLVSCSNLEELPPSVASLSSLEKIELTGTQIKSFPGKMLEEMKKLGSVKIIDSKELFFAPGLFSKASWLTDLHIEGCESITEVEVTLEGHPTLISFSVVGAPHMKRLSLRECRKLENVDIREAGALEELDLSATAIKELPDNIPNLPKLRQLLLLGVPSLRRLRWHRLRRLPDVFCLDQCSNRTINHCDHPQVTQVCVSDCRLFYSFHDATRDLVRAGKLLKTFYVRVTSCMSTTRKMQCEVDMVTTSTPPVYDDVNHRYLTDRASMVSMDDVPPFRKTERHVEISAADRYPHGLKYLLQVTKSISMLDDTHVSCLSNLGDYSFLELEECMLQRCHRMVQVFEKVYARYVGNLKNVHVSYLRSLTHFYRPLSDANNFNALKHLVLEHCPRLEAIVPCDCVLPSLETLDILFCYNLKSIFYDRLPSSKILYSIRLSASSDYYQLPCLRRIHLQELPLLEHLHDGNNPMLTAPAWEELHVRGCWSLRRLPRFRRRQPDKAVKVSGERAWWDKLCWDWDWDDHAGSYKPMLPPAFASRSERVVIQSYLR
jgi:hypothetical protein